MNDAGNNKRSNRSNIVQPAMRAVTVAGIIVAALGVLTLAGLLLRDRHIDAEAMVRTVAVNAVVIGVVLLVYAALRAKGRSIEEAYRLGYDVGYENGFRSGFDAVNDEQRTRDELARRREHPAVGDKRRLS
jgi:hypothetical protein